MPLYVSIAFVPEARLHWYAQTARWVSHYRQLPQVLMTSDTLFMVVAWITAIVPVRWAWRSTSVDSWWTPQDVVLDTYQHQQLVLHHVLMELEHVLARDLVLTVVGSSDGRAYVQRRLVISGSGGSIRHSCETAPRARLRIYHPDWQGQVETPIQLLGLIHEVRAGFFLVQMLAKLCLRQEDMLNAMCLDRSFLFFLQAGKGSILPTMLGLKRMAHTEAAGWRDLSSETGAFLEGSGGACPTNWQTQYRRQRRRTMRQPPEQADLECPERMELHVLGSAGKVPETHQARAAVLCSSPGDLGLVVTARGQYRVDPQIRSDEAHEPGGDSGRQPAGDPVALGPFIAQPGITPAFWSPTRLVRKRLGTNGAPENSHHLTPLAQAIARQVRK